MTEETGACFLSWRAGDNAGPLWFLGDDDIDNDDGEAGR
jgi:hypothetical protein